MMFLKSYFPILNFIILAGFLACGTKKQNQDTPQRPLPSPKNTPDTLPQNQSQTSGTVTPIPASDFSLKILARVSAKKIGDDTCKNSFCLTDTGGTEFQNNVQSNNSVSPFEESCGFSFYRYDSTIGLSSYPTDASNALLDKASFTFAHSLPGYVIDKNPIIFQTSATQNINGTTWYLKDVNSDLMALLDCRLRDSTNTSDPVGFTKRAVTNTHRHSFR